MIDLSVWSAEEKRQMVLCRVMGMLGFEKIDTSTFEQRLIYQKLIYLLQFSGLSLGYGFRWYVRGPFSHDLQYDLDAISRSAAGVRPRAEE